MGEAHGAGIHGGLHSHLVKDVVAALARVERNDARLLKQVRLDDGALNVAAAPENDFDPLAIPAAPICKNIFPNKWNPPEVKV